MVQTSEGQTSRAQRPNVDKHQWTPELQRAYDQSIMKAFPLLPGITPGRMYMANWCRLYLKVITILDMTNEKDTAIHGNRVDGEWQAKSNFE